jgi:hypothetical protein
LGGDSREKNVTTIFFLVIEPILSFLTKEIGGEM